jgi:hypothetical protein
MTDHTLYLAVAVHVNREQLIRSLLRCAGRSTANHLGHIDQGQLHEDEPVTTKGPTGGGLFGISSH